MLRIDTHVHIYRIATTAGLSQASPSVVAMPASSAPVEWLHQDMAAHGIEAAVLVQHSAFGTDNSYIAECVQRFPEQFRGIGLVDPHDARVGDAIASWMARGLSGFRLHPLYEERPEWLWSARGDELFAAAQAHGALLQFHFRPEHAAAIGALAARFPDVPVVLDHLGKPEVTEPEPYPSFAPVLELASLANCYMKIGDYEKASHQAYPWRDTWPFVALLVERFGASRMMWGTGFPGPHRRVPLPEAIAYVEERLPLSAAARSAIMGETPRALFGFGTPRFAKRASVV